jgi:hypothetical protein
MHDVEHHTICYLRDLLVTRAHDDPEITTFLTMWAYEEYWHGNTLGRILEAHGEAAGDVRVTTLRRRVRRSGRVQPWLHSLGSALAGPSWTAIHMSWGAINEWTTQAGYSQLAQLSGHPVLAEVLGRIMRQEGRHINFYASQAEERLGSDRRAQRLTRFALQRFWNPVGSDVMPETEVRCLIEYLFSGVEGRHAAERIDRRIDRLPGLAGLELIGTARRRYVTPGSRDQYSLPKEPPLEQIVERPSRIGEWVLGGVRRMEAVPTDHVHQLAH